MAEAGLIKDITGIKMALNRVLKFFVDKYARKHIPAFGNSYYQMFSFVKDSNLRSRIEEEFYTTRYIYKLMQGLQVEEFLLKAEVKIQLLSYASICEALIHHMLFERLSSHPDVINVQKMEVLKEFPIPGHSLSKIKKELEHDGKEVIPSRKAEIKVEVQKIRFDKKVEIAKQIGFISQDTATSLIDLYSARNSIHIHAEIRKGTKYDLALSKNAFKVIKMMSLEIKAYEKREAQKNKSHLTN